MLPGPSHKGKVKRLLPLEGTREVCHLIINGRTYYLSTLKLFNRHSLTVHTGAHSQLLTDYIESKEEGVGLFKKLFLSVPRQKLPSLFIEMYREDLAFLLSQGYMAIGELYL